MAGYAIIRLVVIVHGEYTPVHEALDLSWSRIVYGMMRFHPAIAGINTRKPGFLCCIEAAHTTLAIRESPSHKTPARNSGWSRAPDSVT